MITQAMDGREVFTSKRTGALKGGLDYERGERKPVPVASRPTRPRADARHSERLNGEPIPWQTDAGQWKTALLLTASFPRDHRTNAPLRPLECAVCRRPKRCGYAYGPLMQSGNPVCDECRMNDWWARVLWVRHFCGEDLYSGSDYIGSHKWGQASQFTEYGGTDLGNEPKRQTDATLRAYGMPGVDAPRNRWLGDMDRASDSRMSVMDGAVIRIGKNASNN